MTPTQTPDRQPPRRRPALGRFSPLWLGVSLFALLLLANIFSAALNQGQALQYSQFKDLLKQGRVSDVTIATETIRGTYLDPEGRTTHFTAVKVEDPDLVKDLQAQTVRF